MKSSGRSAKILYICGGRNFYQASLNRKLAGVAECWRQAGHDVLHVCGGDFLGTTRVATAYGPQDTIWQWYRGSSTVAPIVESISEWRDIRHDRLVLHHLDDLHREWCPDIVWERSCRLHCAGLSFARKIGVPYVLEWKDHLIDYRYSLFRNKALRMEEKKNREANYIVVESEVLRTALRLEGIEAAKVLVAHNAVDVTEFRKSEAARARVRAELGIGPGVVLVGYLGSYAFYHDAVCLVQAAALIAKKCLDRQVKVLMVGAGKGYPESRALAKKLGVLDETLLMMPGVPKDLVPDILSALDIAVLPGSTDIICPIKVQEYMASLLPTVAPDYACNREVLRDGVTGELFAPKDAEALANKILLLARDDALRLRMGHQAREDAAARFSWQATWGAALASILEESVS